MRFYVAAQAGVSSLLARLYAAPFGRRKQEEPLEPLIRAICQKEGLPAGDIRPMSGGQVNRVFLVDQAYVVRIGWRKDAFSRLEQETALLQRLAHEIPVAKMLAFGQHAGHAYQIQQLVQGQKLHSAWAGLSPAAAS